MSRPIWLPMPSELWGLGPGDRWPDTWEEYSYAVLAGYNRHTWWKSWRRKWWLLCHSWRRR